MFSYTDTVKNPCQAANAMLSPFQERIAFFVSNPHDRLDNFPRSSKTRDTVSGSPSKLFLHCYIPVFWG